MKRIHDAKIVSWTIMIKGYIENGISKKAIDTLKKIQLSSV